ncbi:ISAs1 family transposase [Azotobacter chroococcum]|uniref:ISAs1 family transposase n=1 Tax=Azotobacter chroococcum TaxID=353 RepID=UPI001E584ECD|nr:ISAs1 family transposase [Azotobacter chroococcum]
MSHHLPISDVFVSLNDPRQQGKIRHDPVETLVVAVCGVLAGADTFIEIELWAEQRLDRFRRFLTLAHGIPSHDTFGQPFGLIDPDEFEAAFRRWVEMILPSLSPRVVALDGKTRRRSGKAGGHRCIWSVLLPPRPVSCWGSVPLPKSPTKGRQSPSCWPHWRSKRCIVTIDAMGTQPSIAQAVRDRQADYLLAVKENQPRLAESIKDFFETFLNAYPDKTPHRFVQQIDKDHGRLEIRRSHVFEQLQCPAQPERWP